jgi:hypothetical protein
MRDRSAFERPAAARAIASDDESPPWIGGSIIPGSAAWAVSVTR